MARTLKKRNKTLVIDADSLLYEAASVNEIVYEFGEHSVTQTNLQGAKDDFDKSIEALLDACKCSKFLMYITGERNFRYGVLPSYKHNRKGVKRPELLPALKEYALSKYPCKMTSKIEADDACTIHLSADPVNNLLAHIDKDLNQVEGLHYNWRKDSFYELSYAEGQRAFYEQVLSGDSTDGYSGCAGIGKQRAKEILDGYVGVEPFEYVFTRGARKGECEWRWNEVEMKDIWEAIVSQYRKAMSKEASGPLNIEFCESNALIQARVARMLRHDEFKDGEPVLWSYKPLKIDLRGVKAFS